MDLLPGHLELLILRALRWEPTHGTGIAAWIRLVTDDAFAVADGSLYPALQRLVRRGWVESEWGTSEHGRRARFYSLTSVGRSRLAERGAGWERYVAAIERAMQYGNPRALWARRAAT